MNTATLNTANKRENKLRIPSVRTSTYGLKSLKYHGVILWNSLTLSLRYIESKKQFSKKVKQIFIADY